MNPFSYRLISALPFGAFSQLVCFERQPRDVRHERQGVVGNAESSLVSVPSPIDMDVVARECLRDLGWVSRASQLVRFYRFLERGCIRRHAHGFSPLTAGSDFMLVVCTRSPGEASSSIFLTSCDGLQETRIFLRERMAVMVNSSAVTTAIRGRAGFRACIVYYSVDARRGAVANLPPGVHSDALVSVSVHDAFMTPHPWLFQNPNPTQTCFSIARYVCVAGGERQQPLFRVFTNGVTYSLTVSEAGGAVEAREPVPTVAGCGFLGFVHDQGLAFSCDGRTVVLSRTEEPVPNTNIETFVLFPVPHVPLCSLASMREMHIIVRAIVNTLVDATAECAGADWAVSEVAREGEGCSYRLYSVRYLNGVICQHDN